MIMLIYLSFYLSMSEDKELTPIINMPNNLYFCLRPFKIMLIYLSIYVGVLVV